MALLGSSSSKLDRFFEVDFFLQDETSRLTLVSRQPLGGSSLKSGQLEIMMDRRLMQVGIAFAAF